MFYSSNLDLSLVITDQIYGPWQFIVFTSNGYKQNYLNEISYHKNKNIFSFILFYFLYWKIFNSNDL